MEKSNAGIALPANPTINNGCNCDQSIFLKLKIKNGRNAIPAIPILKLATCIGENANNPFFIKIKEAPQVMERRIKMAKPIVVDLEAFVISDN